MNKDLKIFLQYFTIVAIPALLFQLLILINVVEKPRKYIYKIEVTYLDSSKDTIYTRDIPHIDTDIFNSSSVLEEGMKEIAIGVRSYKVISKKLIK